MRIQIPIRLLNHSCGSFLKATVSATADENADLNVFSKHFDKDENLKEIADGITKGYLTIMDVSDDHFDRERGVYYSKMCEMADHLTCNSENMQERIYEVTGRLARIVQDPITFPALSFKPYEKGDTPGLLWFGHKAGAFALFPWANASPYGIRAICNAKIQHPKVLHTEWGLGVVETEIENYDIVLLPTLSSFPWVKCKSPNRAVDAIQAGKYVITDNPDIYGDLKDYISIIPQNDGDALRKELLYWQTNPEEVAAKIKAGKEFIAKKYNDLVVLDGWLDAFKDVGLLDAS